MSLPFESACTGQPIDTWKYDLVKRHFGVKEEDGGGNIVDVVTGGGGEMAEEKVEKERGFKIVDVEEDDSKENNEAINDVKASDDADDESGGEWIGQEQHDVSTVTVLFTDSLKVENKVEQNQYKDVLFNAGYVQNVKDMEHKMETVVILGDDNILEEESDVVKVEDVDNINLKKVGKDEHLINLAEVEVLAADKLGHNYDECFSETGTEEADEKQHMESVKVTEIAKKNSGKLNNMAELEDGVVKVEEVKQMDYLDSVECGQHENIDTCSMTQGEVFQENIESRESCELSPGEEAVKVFQDLYSKMHEEDDEVLSNNAAICIQEEGGLTQIELDSLIQGEETNKLVCREIEEIMVLKTNETVRIINIEEENVSEYHENEFVKVDQTKVLTENFSETVAKDIIGQLLFNILNTKGNALKESDNYGQGVGCEPVHDVGENGSIPVDSEHIHPDDLRCEPVHQDVNDTEQVGYDSNFVVAEIIKSLIDKVLHEAESKASAPIDASKVTFSCLDIRLKTGFPAPVTKKDKNCTLQKNCLSIILTGDRGNLMKSLGALESLTDKAKFVQDSAVVCQQFRRDLVFTTETMAAICCNKVSKYFHSNVSLKMITLSEADLGYPRAPVLTEGELMYILKFMDWGNIMDVFDGKVVMDRGRNICFTFRNMASLNLFLNTTVAAPDITSLGLLRRNMDRIKKEQQLNELDGKFKARSPEMLRLTVEHPLSPPHKLAKRRKEGREKTGRGWDKLEKMYDFRIIQSTKTTKVLKFRNKLDLYEFWIRETVNLMTKVHFYTMENENETKVKKKLVEAKAVKEVKERTMNENKGFDQEQLSNNQLELWKQKVKEMKSKARDSQIKLNKKKDEVNLIKIKLNNQDCFLKNLISQRIELEEIIKSKLSQGLSEKQKNVLAEIKEETEAIVELEEKLFFENDLRRSISGKITKEDGKKMKEDLARRTLNEEINSLSNLDTSEADMYRMHPPSLVLTDNQSFSCESRYQQPRLSLSNILSLTWKSENQEGSNYFPCLLAFLRSVSSFVLAVVEEGEDIFLELSSYGCQELNKVLYFHARDEGRDWTQLDALHPRYRCRPDELNNNYCFDFIIRPEFVCKQTKDQIVKETKAAGGTVHFVAHKVRCTFSSKREYVRALTSRKLTRYHMIHLSRDNLEQTWGRGDNNYYKGSVCLTESNILSIYWMGEEEAGYADCLSAFLKDSRIKEVLLVSNIKFLITFHSLSAMITSLHDYCQASCNTLEKLIRMPVRCKMVSRSGYFSLLCPSTAVKQDLHSYRHMCRMEVEPRRICSKFKLCLVNILRERDVQLKYPEIVFNHTHFLCKDGDTLPRRIPLAEPVHHDHDLDADDDHQMEGDAPPQGDQREVTSDYEESLISEPAGDARF